MAYTENFLLSDPTDGPPPPGAPMPPQALLMQIASAYGLSQALYVAAVLHVADELADSPLPADELAQRVGADPDALYRLLRALTGAGVFAEVDDQCFGLTPVAEGLRDGVTGSLRDIVIMSGANWHWQAWGALLESVKTGMPAFTCRFGTDLYTYLHDHPEAASAFNAGMANFAESDNAAVLKSYDFSGVHRIVDVGGGTGTLLPMLLKQYPEAEGVLFDLAPGIEAARPLIEDEDLTDRCTLIVGNFFEKVPEGGDLYLLKYIVHNWDDARARAILAQCRRAMAVPGKILLVETILTPGPFAAYNTLLDLEMLVTTPGGRERTEEEYRWLLEAAGCTLTRLVPTGTPMYIIEAVPAVP